MLNGERDRQHTRFRFVASARKHLSQNRIFAEEIVVRRCNKNCAENASRASPVYEFSLIFL